MLASLAVVASPSSAAINTATTSPIQSETAQAKALLDGEVSLDSLGRTAAVDTASATTKSPAEQALSGGIDATSLTIGTSKASGAYPADLCAAVRTHNPKDACLQAMEVKVSNSAVTAADRAQLAAASTCKTAVLTRNNKVPPTMWTFQETVRFCYGGGRVTNASQSCYVVQQVYPYSVRIVECSNYAYNSTTRHYQVRGQVSVFVKDAAAVSYTFSPYIRAYSSGGTTHFYDW